MQCAERFVRSKNVNEWLKPLIDAFYLFVMHVSLSLFGEEQKKL
jgi:hypothetical protein